LLHSCSSGSQCLSKTKGASIIAALRGIASVRALRIGTAIASGSRSCSQCGWSRREFLDSLRRKGTLNLGFGDVPDWLCCSSHSSNSMRESLTAPEVGSSPCNLHLPESRRHDCNSPPHWRKIRPSGMVFGLASASLDGPLRCAGYRGRAVFSNQKRPALTYLRFKAPLANRNLDASAKDGAEPATDVKSSLAMVGTMLSIGISGWHEVMLAPSSMFRAIQRSVLCTHV
jgi:hypothetical protein